MPSADASFTCPKCRRTSYSPDDIREGYCGACHDYSQSLHGYEAEQRELAKLTSDEAQEIHELAMDTDPEHDRSSCWCCCMDCDFPAEEILAEDRSREDPTKR